LATQSLDGLNRKTDADYEYGLASGSGTGQFWPDPPLAKVTGLVIGYEGY
jgi:hypothetical protein